MKYFAICVVLLLLAVSVWRFGLIGQPVPAAGQVIGAADQSGKAAQADCKRDMTGTVMEAGVSARRLLGMRVLNPLDEEIGRVADLILDQCGAITHVVVHVGGFMGIGGENVPLPVDRVRVRPLERTDTWVAMVRETRRHMLREHEEVVK